MKLEKLDFVMIVSFASGVIFFILFATTDRKSYFFYPCITLLVISIISFFANIIMQKVQKRKKIREIPE